MKKKFSGSWPAFIAAFIISCLLWYLVIMDDSPMVHISLGYVPVTILNTGSIKDAGYAYFFEDNTSVEVSVNVIQPRGWFVENDDIRLTANLSDMLMAEGISDIYIHPEVVQNQSVIGNNYKLSKSTLKVRLEKLETIMVPVNVVLNGRTKDGYTTGICKQDLDYVSVRLPRSLKDDGIYSEVFVDIEDADQTVNSACTLNFYSAKGTLLDCATAQIFPEQSYVNVSVPVGRKKTVTLDIPDYSQAADTGYRCTSVEPAMNSVDIVVPDGVKMPEDHVSVPLKMLGISGRKDASYEQEIDMAALFDQRIAFVNEEGQSNQAAVIIQKLVKKSVNIPAASVELLYNHKNFECEVTQDVTVEFLGLSEHVSRLNAEHIHLMVDLTDYKEGSYVLDPSIRIDDTLAFSNEVKIITNSRVHVRLTGINTEDESE